MLSYRLKLLTRFYLCSKCLANGFCIFVACFCWIDDVGAIIPKVALAYDISRRMNYAKPQHRRSRTNVPSANVT